MDVKFPQMYNKYTIRILCYTFWGLTTAYVCFVAYTRNEKDEERQGDFLRNFNSKEVVVNESIFYVVTTEENSLTGRMYCSIETAARAMPNKTVFVLLRDQKLNTSCASIKSLLTYPTIKLRRYDPMDILKQVELDDWYLTLERTSNSYTAFHLSDAVRPALLYLYGGISLDTDVIMRKTVEDLPDFLAMQDDSSVIVAVIKFGQGHPFLKMWLDSIMFVFTPTEWGSVGGNLVSFMIRELCENNNLMWLYENQGTCKQSIPRIYSPDYFYRIKYNDHYKFFEAEYAREVLEVVKDSHAVHFWNKMNQERKPQEFSALTMLALKYCPAVYSATGDNL